ncbi:MAG: hypothetical protein R3181_14095 [Rubricoccaceae bacterium]|nr:hypothetical protein [Rubricoccaceae bacterium]
MRLLSLGLLALLAAATLAPSRDGSSSGPAASSPSVWSIGYARTHPGAQAGYLTFLELNWAEARRRAIEEGVVRSFRILARPDTAEAPWDVMMITEYADSAAYADREAYFTAMFARPDWETRLVDGKSARAFADLVGDETVLRSVAALP